MPIGGILQGIAQIGSNIINSGGLAVNRSTALKNLALQNKAMYLNMLTQGMTWDREDNAVQRRVADLRAAGLSPVLAAGSAAAASPARAIEAPQNEFRFPKWDTPDIAGLINSLRLTQSQVEKNTAETSRMKILTGLDVLNNPSKLGLINAKTKATLEEALLKSITNDIYKTLGVGPYSSEVGRTVKDIATILDEVMNRAKNQNKAQGKTKGAQGDW